MITGPLKSGGKRILRPGKGLTSQGRDPLTRIPHGSMPRLPLIKNAQSIRTLPSPYRFMLPSDILSVHNALRVLDKVEPGPELTKLQRIVAPWGIEIPEPRKSGSGMYGAPWEVRLAGGGAKGPLLLPFLEELYGKGGRPLSFTGSSVGTIPAAMGALGMTPKDMRLAMSEFEGVLAMPEWEKWWKEARERDHSDSIDDLGSGLGLALESAFHTARAVYHQGGRLSDPSKLRTLLHQIMGDHLKSTGLDKLFKDPFDPRMGELLSALVNEPEAGTGLLSFPLTDYETSRLIRVDPITMPHQPIVEAMIGAMAFPLLFKPQMVSNRLVWDGGAKQNVGFPGFFGPEHSVSANFRKRGKQESTSRSFLLDTLQLGTKATGTPFQIQHHIDNLMWLRGAFGQPVPIPFDPGRISTISEATREDIEDMSKDVVSESSRALENVDFTGSRDRSRIARELVAKLVRQSKL